MHGNILDLTLSLEGIITLSLLLMGDDIYGFSHLKSNSFLKITIFPNPCFIIKATIQNADSEADSDENKILKFSFFFRGSFP